MCSTCRTGFTPLRRCATLGLELGLVWVLFLPRRWRIACFFVVTLWQIPVILTANYTFLNYLVLLLGVLLLDDRFLQRWLPKWLLRDVAAREFLRARCPRFRYRAVRHG